MKLYHILTCLLAAISMVGCNNEDETTHQIVPENNGTFVDARDGYEYHWVRLGGLDWCIENSHFYTDEATCTIQQDDVNGGSLQYSDKHLERLGYLYSYEGALAAVPDGWRLPTDEDWQTLEKALGMPASEADKNGWRGSDTGTLMQQDGEGTMLAMRMGGYYNSYYISSGTNYRLLSVCGFFWSSTKDNSKSGDYYFYRKLFYDNPEVYRESMETKGNKLSVRFVRNAQ